MDPNNPQVLYVSMWSARHSAWFSDVFEHQELSGMYKSTDGGTTWQKLAGGLPAKIGRIGISISRSNSKVVYAQVDAEAPALYRSNDAGATWAAENNEDRITGRGQDFAHVSVDPSDENTVYVANTSTYRSTNGGKNLRQSTALPAAMITTPSGSIPKIRKSLPSRSIRAQPQCQRRKHLEQLV